MKILVTGGNGQLAQSLVKVGGVSHELILCDLPEGDITSAEAMWRLSEGVDAIVNCAAWTAVDTAEDNEDKALMVNGLGAGVVASTAALRGIPMVQISTDYVFDGSCSSPLGEDAVVKPLGAYGRTKLAGEDAVRASGARAAIVRTAWLYSEFGNNFVKTMLRVGALGKPLKVVSDQHGCPTYAPDLARAVLMLLEKEVSGGSCEVGDAGGFSGTDGSCEVGDAGGFSGTDGSCEVGGSDGSDGFSGIWHFCGAGMTTWFDFAREIFAQAASLGLVDAAGAGYGGVEVVPVTTVEWGARAPRPEWSVLSCAKIAAAGIPVPDWHDSLRECLGELGIVRASEQSSNERRPSPT